MLLIGTYLGPIQQPPAANHAGIGRMPRTHVAIEIAIAATVSVERHDERSLPAGWDHADLRVARAFGDAWIRERRTAVLTDEWRVAGAYIDDTTSRREAFNIIFSMPAGTPPEAVREATADAARELFEGHKYVFVLHEDQGAPHVHLSVRADRYDGVRLAPRKADLDRWRAVFARGLQDRGVNAVATRQPVRAANRNYRKLWEERAAGRGGLTRQRPAQRTSAKALAARAEAIMAWEQIARALASSKDPADVRLAVDAVRYLAEVAPGGQEAARVAQQQVAGRSTGLHIAPKPQRDRSRSPRR